MWKLDWQSSGEGDDHMLHFDSTDLFHGKICAIQTHHSKNSGEFEIVSFRCAVSQFRLESAFANVVNMHERLACTPRSTVLIRDAG